jgi:DMSO/TMAO reductase YedYZ molybdopterin-dependent catalytic subunit
MASTDDLIFVADPDHLWVEALHAGLVGLSRLPLNCETPPPLLGGDVTPTGRFFRRNHFPIPDLDAGSWRLEVGGLVRRQLTLGLDDLKQLGSESLTAVLECAGNGRTLFSPPTTGECWGLGAVGNARWTGVLLADVLELAGIEAGAREVVFRGADQGAVEGSTEVIAFERSLDISAARQSGALLAFAMNDKPLSARHGHPVRLVVPGQYAVASVKWLAGITVTDQPFDGFFQAVHYVYEWRRDGAEVREPVGVQRVRAMITEPATGDEVAHGAVTVRGVAWSGAARVARVEVSLDDGAWRAAALTGEPGPHGWQQWELRTGTREGGRAEAAGKLRIRARATDRCGRTQSGQPEWNRLGYGGNFIHEVCVALR